MPATMGSGSAAVGPAASRPLGSLRCFTYGGPHIAQNCPTQMGPADNPAIALQQMYGMPYIGPGYGHQPPYPLMYQMPCPSPGMTYYQPPPGPAPEGKKPNISVVQITAAPAGSY